MTERGYCNALHPGPYAGWPMLIPCTRLPGHPGDHVRAVDTTQIPEFPTPDVAASQDGTYVSFRWPRERGEECLVPARSLTDRDHNLLRKINEGEL